MELLRQPWHLRVHVTGHDEAFEIYQYLSKLVDVILCVFEQHDNRPHIHMIFDERKLSKSRVFQKFKEQFPHIKGNQMFACQDVTKVKKKKGLDEPEGGDIEKAKAYLCKGVSVDETPVVVGETKVDVDFYHTQYWKRFMELRASSNREVNMGCQNDSSLVVKAKSKNWSERVYDEIIVKYQNECICINKFQLSNHDKEKYDLARRKIFRYMMKCLGKSVKKISGRIIEELWKGFMNAIVQNTGTEDEANAYSDKIFDTLIQ